MKIFYLLACFVFITGLAFQFLHFPFGGFLLFSSCLYLWIHALVHFARNAKTNLPESLFYMAIAALTTYVMLRLQFWGWAQLVYYVAILLTLACLILYIKRKISFQLPPFMLLIFFSLILILAYTPSYRIYYLVRLNQTLNGETRDLDYRSWDKYSWFLYLRDKQEEALDANKKAKEAVKASLKGRNALDAVSYSTQIELHTLQIKEKKWESYP